KIKIAINGFGRIGRNLFRLLIHHPDIEVVAVNDLTDTATMAHLLKYDSVHGKLNEDISVDENHLSVDNTKIVSLHEKDITKLNSKPLCIDLVIEATGEHKTTELLQNHINNGAKRVILSVPPEDNKIKTIVLGVNENIIDKDDKIVSNAS